MNTATQTKPKTQTQTQAPAASKPTIALFTGDPAGIGPELVVRLLADSDAARQANIVLVGSRRVLEQAAAELGKPLAYEVGTAADARGDFDTPILLESALMDDDGFERATVAAKNGRYMLDGLALGLDLWRQGVAQVLCFAPLNKGALRAGGMNHADELHWFCEQLAFDGVSVEFNVLDTLWTSRVTSHVPLKDVSALLSAQGIADGIELLSRGLTAAGIASPRIAVCGFNPHNGDNGSFGREEIDVIEPGVQMARARGFPADGPYPADTAFVRATRRGPNGENQGYDGVLTMYHDQGQIAMKLMGFDRGVTVQGGLPVPITTPAHGTAYEIAGKGVANDGAMKNAFGLACRFGQQAMQQRATA